jgi:hypothetical protein
MKTFFAVLGAILTAGVIFLIGFGMVSHYTDWQRRKDSVIRVINQNDSEFSEINSAFKSQSLEGKQSDLRRLERLIALSRQARDVLKTILENKPFFALDAEEKKWLAGITSDTKAETPAPLPSNDQTPAMKNATAPSSFVRLTLDTEVYTPDKRAIPLAAGLRLRVLSTQDHEVLIEYQGSQYWILTAITKPDP